MTFELFAATAFIAAAYELVGIEVLIRRVRSGRVPFPVLGARLIEEVVLWPLPRRWPLDQLREPA